MGRAAAAVNRLLRQAFFLLLIADSLTAMAQDPYVIAGTVSISGNHITYRNIIIRELKFKEGDTLKTDQLPRILSQAKENIFNTRLFNFVTLIQR